MTAHFESLDPTTAAKRLEMARKIEDGVVGEMGPSFTEAMREGEKHHDDPRMLRHLAARAVAGRPGAPPAWKARLAEADTHLWAIALGWISFGVQVGRRHARGMEHDDLEQIVAIALHRAAISWDPQKGAFSTFSANWVKVRCEREERDRDMIPIASGTRGKMALLRNLRGLHPEWDDATLAAESGLSIKRVRSLDHHRDAITKVVSLDAPIEGMERGAMLVEIVADPQSVDPIREVEARHDVDFALAGLGKREGVILRQRYGLGCGHARTLREIGDGRGLSRERIRQITEAAEIKIRANLRQAGRRDSGTIPVICGPRKKVATPTRTKVIALLRAEPGLRNAEIRKRLGVGSPEVYALARDHLGIAPPIRRTANGDSGGLLRVLALLGEKPDLGNSEIHAALGFRNNKLFACARRRLGIRWRRPVMKKR